MEIETMTRIMLQTTTVIATKDTRCPHCGEDRMIEKIGTDWFCNVCAYSWKAKTQ